jgi:4-amino-4-deoxy-L-arabinose transferase-like glycosyltransferase
MPGTGLPITGMQRIRAFAERPGSATLILLLITFSKAGLFVTLDHLGKVRPFQGDNATEHYIPTGTRILNEGRFNGPDSRPDSKVPPGYPVVIAAALAVTGNRAWVSLVVLQMAADGGIALAIYWLARRMSSAFAGLVAGIAWLIYPPELAISTWITPETMFTLLLVLGIMGLFREIEGEGFGGALAGGILLGVATLFRGTPLVLPLVLLPAFFVLGKLRLWLAATAAMVLVVAPWTIRNYVVLHDFIPVSVGSGSVMLQGSDARFFSGEGKSELYPQVFAAAAEAGIPQPHSNLESGIDGWMGRMGRWVYVQRLRDRPLSYGPFLAHKAVRLWYGTESANPKTQLALGLCSLLVVPAGIWQWWRWRRRWTGSAFVLLSVLAYFIVLHFVTLPQIRYMVPIYPFLLLGACHWYLEKLDPQVSSATAKASLPVL